MLYIEKMENMWNRVDVRLANNAKYYLKCTSKPSYMSRKIFDNTLVVIRKSKVALKLIKPPYIGMGILKMNEMSM